MDDEYQLERSPRSQSITDGGHVLAVEIYRGEDSDWILEVVDEFGNSTVWDDQFATDQAAWDELQRTLLEEGVEVMVGMPSDEAPGDSAG